MESVMMQEKDLSTSQVVRPFLEITRTVRASRERVYQAWTKAELIQNWFGPGKWITLQAELDVKVGGSYAIQMQGIPEGQDAIVTVWVRGVYRKVLPNELLQFSWVPDWAPGETSLVTVSLKDVSSGTELNLKHQQFADENSRIGHGKGWSSSLDKLVNEFSN